MLQIDRSTHNPHTSNGNSTTTTTPHTAHLSEYFVQSALDALSAHIAILDEAGYIIGINEAWRRFAEENHYTQHGYGLNTNYLHICDHANGQFSYEAPLVARGIREVISHRRNEFYIEYPCHSPREKRWFVMHITRFEWNGSQRLIIAHQNVTELKEVQIQLDESKKRLEAILNNVPDGIITISANGRIESMNPAGSAIFGYDPREVVGQNVNVLFTEPQRSLPNRRLMSNLVSNGEREWTGQRKDDSLFPMYFAVSELYLGSRRIYTGIVQDLTERKRIEAELLEKERITIALDKERELRDFKNRFFNVMSHELRTPLSSILLASDLLKLYGDIAPADEKRLYLENIQAQVGHLSALVKDMQTIIRSDARELHFLPEALDLSAMCRQIIDEFQVVHHETHRLVLNTSSDRLIAVVDQKLMRQMLTNLIANAIKYSPPFTTILVELKTEHESLCINVKDQGIGIPEEDVPMLFTPFHRGANVANTPGTGLGLSIVKQAVEAHGGTISITSKVDYGTTFTISLPYRAK